MLAIDLGVVNRKAHVVSMREALTFTFILAVLALAFTGFVYFAYENHWLGLGATLDQVDGRINDGRLAAVKFLTGYVIELSLSADNVFVIALIFQHLRVPPQYQHRVLFWGILGALAMRGVMIVVGAQLVARYHWILYLFGIFLVYTAVKMLISRDENDVPEEAWVMRQLRRMFPITNHYEGQHFIVQHAGRRMLTPLAVALVLVETTELYFALAGMIDKFKYLKVSLAAILGLVGVKMLVADVLKDFLGPNFNFILLGIVALILGGGIVASIIASRRGGEGPTAPPPVPPALRPMDDPTPPPGPGA